MTLLSKFTAYILCIHYLLPSCSRESANNKSVPNSNLVHFAYADLSSYSLNEMTDSYSLVDSNKIFQRVDTGADQDITAIPHFIVGNWEVFAETPLSDKSPIRLVFMKNGVDPPNPMLFYPSFDSLYETTAAATKYEEHIEEFTRFCSERVVHLDLSKAIVPVWYYSRISEFSKLRYLRISHKSIDLKSDFPMPDSLTGIDFIDFPFDTTLLEFIRGIGSLNELVLTRSYASQVTAPIAKINRDQFEDWISIYRKGLNRKSYHTSIDSIALIGCDEQTYFGFLRLRMPSLKTVNLNLEEVYPGGGILSQTEAVCHTIITTQNWPTIRNITFLLDGLNRDVISHKLTSEKSAQSGYTFERLLRQTIDDSINGQNQVPFKYELIINSKLGDLNTAEPIDVEN